MIAHRGASLVAPENTLPAFYAAVQNGADAIELDVQLTADRIPVVIHDHTLERTTNGAGAVVSRSWEELKILDAGKWFGSEFKGARVPSLEEVFDRFGDSINLNIELANYSTPFDELPAIVCSMIARRYLHDRVLVSSFNPIALLKVKAMKNELSTGLLLMPGVSSILKRFLHPNLLDMDRSYLERPGLSARLNVWTVNEVEDMDKLLERNVAGIITDAPGLLRRRMRILND